MFSLSDYRPTAAYIDFDALADNYHSVKRFVGINVAYMAIVKADAYGHGAVPCSRRLESEGVDWFGVAIPEEGVELRRAGVERPILCLGSFWPGQERPLVENRLTPVIYDRRGANRLDNFAAEAGTTIDIHVKIDTGMGRVGVDHVDSADFAAFLKTLKGLKIDGLLTHFASAENPAENEFTNTQIGRFEAACAAFRGAGHDPEWIDMANSPGAIAHRASHGNMVRLGGALYGLLDDILPSDIRQPELKPVLSLCSRIAHLRHVPSGTTLGYGRTFATETDSMIALVPIGYADGYPRGLSNRGRAIVNGVFVPIVGRISMDWILLDVTNGLDAAIDDEVTLIGTDGRNTIKASDLAHEIGTIGYEITCGISPRVPRIYLGSRETSV